MNKVVLSLYVHQSILEWFENEIQKLHPINNIIVEEIFHNQFDNNINHVVSDRYSYHQMFDQIWMDSKFKMPWISNRTYFLQVDDNYNVIFPQIKSDLDNYGLSQYIVNLYRMNVAWITIEEIEIFEFSPVLNIDQLAKIDQIFLKCISSRGIGEVMSLYLAEPLPWHDVHDDFIDIDSLALDICAGEWKPNNLLNDFTVEELLCLELANKDFRVPYYNDYLDRYMQNVLNSKVKLSMDSDVKYEYSLPYFHDSDVAGYFIFKFHRKFSTLYTSAPSYKKKFDYISKLLKIPRFDFVYDKMLFLTQDKPDPIDLVSKYKGVETIIYQIHNYNYFNCELFNELLRLPNKYQVYEFNLCDGFNFIVPLLDSAIPVCYCSSEIQISLCESSSEHAEKLSLFIRYLIILFKGHCNSAELLIINCYIPDFSIFENIQESFSKLEFCFMDLKHAELLTLAPYLSNKNYLSFSSCENITDTDVLKFLQISELEPKNLSIEGFHGCTPLVYFILAEFLMGRKKTSTITMDEMPIIKGVANLFNCNQIGFHEANGMLCLINTKTNEQIDYFQLMNYIDVDDEPPFEYT